MSDVFVSYKAEDRRRVRPLVEALEADGYSVWWDEQIGGGATWRHAIETELNAAKSVIVAWSKRSVGPDGTFVQDEATRAQQRRVYVPVLIDKVHLPLGFGEMQALPLSGWKGDRSDPHYQAVLAAVRRIVGDGAGTASEPRSATGIDRRLVLGGGVAAMAAAGIGGWVLLKPDAASASDSIAVLPFANLSGDPRQAYFSDGIAEELRSALARLAGLKVVGRTSSEAVREEDAETAAKRLGVDNILTGSVRQSPSTIRVGAQLIDGRTGLERWSQSYDRAPGDAIKIQTDIAENVARALRVTLGNFDDAKLAIGGTANAAAQNLYLEANNTRDASREDFQHAIGLLDQAIALDPNYAQAFGLKAIFVLELVNQFASGERELAQGRADALRLARQSIRMAPDLPIGHGALALIYGSNLQISPALAEHKRTVALAPGDVDAIRSYSGFLTRLGESSEAIRLAREAIALDPLNGSSHIRLATALYFARRYAESLSGLEKISRDSPDLVRAPVAVANNLLMLGKTNEAAQSYAQEKPDDPFRLVGEAVLAARSGDRNQAMQKTQRLKQLYGDAASYQYGQIQAQLGETDQAIAELERGWQVKDAGLMLLRVDPWLDPVRDDSRFSRLVQKMNFPA